MVIYFLALYKFWVHVLFYFICLLNVQKTNNLLIRSCIFCQHLIYYLRYLHGLEPWSSQTNNFKINTCLFLATRSVLLAWCKDWLARYQDNVSGISCHDASGLRSQWGSTKRLPWLHAVTSPYPSWYDLRCCQDGQLQQSTILHMVCLFAGSRT